MPLDKKFANQIVEMLRPVGHIEGRAMFGGFGIWERGAMFALLDSESVLYFKTDATTEANYQEERSKQFAPQVGNKPPMPMPYWSVPAFVLDDQEELESWAKRAIAIAHASAKRPTPKKAPAKKPAVKKATAKASTKKPAKRALAKKAK